VPYLKLTQTGSPQPVKTVIGYRVVYMHGAQQMQSQVFTRLWRAQGFLKSLRMGARGQVVPVYE
jgi:hypothetical protein